MAFGTRSTTSTRCTGLESCRVSLARARRPNTAAALVPSSRANVRIMFRKSILTRRQGEGRRGANWSPCKHGAEWGTLTICMCFEWHCGQIPPISSHNNSSVITQLHHSPWPQIISSHLIRNDDQTRSSHGKTGEKRKHAAVWASFLFVPSVPGKRGHREGMPGNTAGRH